MKINRLFFVFCLTAAGCFGPPRDKVIISDTYINKEEKNYKSLLLVYAGTAVDRIMLDNLGDELTSKLEKKGVAVFKEFLSNESNRTGKYVAGLANERKVDAVLEIIPLDGAKVGEYYRLHPGFETRKAKANQRYSLLLYDLASQDKPVWGSRLNVYITINRSNPYANIANKIIDRLQENAIWRDQAGSK
jgi:hypothetical protein